MSMAKPISNTVKIPMLPPPEDDVLGVTIGVVVPSDCVTVTAISAVLVAPKLSVMVILKVKLCALLNEGAVTVVVAVLGEVILALALPITDHM